MLGAARSLMIAMVARRRNVPLESRVPLRELPRITWDAFPALMMPVILLGCLYSEITTPTEAAAVAALYGLLVSAIPYRTVGFGDVYRSLVASARTSISLGLLIAAALVFNFVIASENVPKTMSALLQSYNLTPLMFLLIVNILLLILGCFLDGTTIFLVILPMRVPTAQALDIDPVHFGMF
jgi:tripartite ATP-independent transporter DctM subunit